ncbi:hypothetical protein AVEN_6351-1, partial [Araneus ventricosus]
MLWREQSTFGRKPNLPENYGDPLQLIYEDSCDLRLGTKVARVSKACS